MKKFLFTALTLGSSMASIAHSDSKHQEAWDEPSAHELIGAKAEDVYYFDEIGNMLGHFGQDGKDDRIRHVAGMDVDTEVPAAKMIDKPENGAGLAETSSSSESKSEAEEAPAADDDEQEPRYRAPGHTPEERVARVAVTKSEKFKSAALKAAKEAAVSKTVANRATENAHAYQKQAAEAKEIAAKAADEEEKTRGQI
tara:strand:+ start:123 stop:716 length:594 start_codon:yes stop_codon:yes gene_type:complete